MKYLSYIVALLLTYTLSAQEIKLKKEVVYVSDSPTFSFTKKAMGNELYIYKLNTKDELLSMVVDNNNTESKVDDSKKIIFAQQKSTIASKNFRSRDYEFLIALLLEEKVIDLKGEVNNDNLIRFKAKYDDGNINHTMMR
ncbi:MAG TPA: hypothetical protein PKN96_06330 [Flavobacterium sp.]|uniref:hypothetical protein n=1 Tax=Flavobacterium sp. TaxID=239 RepID=UPI002CFA10B0|nr:hypothetical protein [Flavobacterium sp.]HNP32890.1 hypothetical protein [Flavobacterium sp.]